MNLLQNGYLMHYFNISLPSSQAVMDALEEAADDPDKRELVDQNGDGIPDWCNPRKPMGAWLNFKKMREWCRERGYNKLSPYGGAKGTEDAAAAENEVEETAAEEEEVLEEEPVDDLSLAEADIVEDVESNDLDGDGEVSTEEVRQARRRALFRRARARRARKLRRRYQQKKRN